VHSNGTVDMAFGTLARTGGATPTYAGAGGSCSAAYCHGNFTGGNGAAATPTWVTAGTLGCTSCHGNPPALPHPQSTACADCHGTGYSQTSVVASTHVDGAVTLVAAHSAAAAGGCAQCHGNATLTPIAGADANAPAAPPIGTRSETATTARAVGAHQLHVNTAMYRANPIACSECHAVPAAGDKTHANGAVNITFGALATTGGITTAAWNTTAFTCANVYCHGNFTGGKKTYTPTWTAANTTTTCGTCHGLPPSPTEDPAHPAVAAGGSCSGCHTGYNATTAGGSVDPTKHMNGVVDASGGESAGGAACAGCHGAIYNTMIATSTKLSKHTVGSDAPADNTTAWTGTNLAAVATTGRSCVDMCHSDHPHGTTAHNTNVYADATTQTARTGAKLATDFDATQASGGLCTSCHQKPIDANNPAQKPAVAKATFQNTAHDFKANTVGTTIYTWQYTLHDGSAFQRDCTKCHASQAEGQTPTVAANNSATVGPHASDFGQLLAGNTNPATTPASFVCFNCHGSGTVGLNMSGKDIYTQAAKAQGHGGKITSSATHDSVREAAATYNSGAYSGTNRHANCLDCHDEHMAGKVKHTVGPNDGAIIASSPLYGASGVGYTGTLPANFAAIPSTNLATVTLATAEYQVCFKCHTGFAFGTTPPTGTSTLAETDLAQEFNVNNKSGHPVVNTLANQTGSSAPKALVAAQLLAPWNTSPGAQTMTCSDCHNADAASPAAQGPHGSAVPFMLTGTNRAWPYTAVGTTGTVRTISSGETSLGTANGLFCRNCHPQQNNTASNWIHRTASGQHGTSTTVGACVACHIRVPHGGKVSRLIVTTNAPARYKVGTPNFASFAKAAAKDSYTTTNFKSVCGQHSSGTGGEAW
jgi:predicted CxxxxCH...CXXCH cytochrome family protein